MLTFIVILQLPCRRGYHPRMKQFNFSFFFFFFITSILFIGFDFTPQQNDNMVCHMHPLINISAHYSYFTPYLFFSFHLTRYVIIILHSFMHLYTMHYWLLHALLTFFSVVIYSIFLASSKRVLQIFTPGCFKMDGWITKGCMHTATERDTKQK